MMQPVCGTQALGMKIQQNPLAFLLKEVSLEAGAGHISWKHLVEYSSHACLDFIPVPFLVIATAGIDPVAQFLWMVDPKCSVMS